MTDPSTHADLEAAHELALRDFRLMESWNDAEASAIIAPSMVNDEAMAEPPAARAPGVAGARATYDWLHAAYEDLHWTIHNLVAEGGWVVAHTTMSGRQVGPFVTYTPDGEVGRVFPPTGRSFAVTQTHWFRVADGQLIEHHANRDDMGQAMQLGWM
ncbi:MAG: ester cyclase [Actinobacteria bacterium]|nr:ester cyclase [Actinomycetota bacterium]